MCYGARIQEKKYGSKSTSQSKHDNSSVELLDLRAKRFQRYLHKEKFLGVQCDACTVSDKIEIHIRTCMQNVNTYIYLINQITNVYHDFVCN